MRVAAILPILALSLFLATVAPKPAKAWHANVPPYMWEEYYSSVPAASRIVYWRGCASTTYEENLNGVALNNWKSKFGQSIKWTQLADSCTIFSDFRLWARNTAQTHLECNNAAAVACIEMLSTYDAGNGSRKIQTAIIRYDYQWINDLNHTAGQSLHIFAHEFGHGMTLGDADSHVCGTSVMSFAGCKDMVHDGPYPNDVCFPDFYGGYGQSRCN
ncbi:MAG: hypothetical protein ONB14_12395 [candidate division KSB1 bacterium]|nr:hypothetical protein [candidate division KSB1 bacterium]